MSKAAPRESHFDDQSHTESTVGEPERKRERPARGDGREALIRAIIRVVARDGVDGLTFRSVAEEAGVTHGLVHYHFGTREAMINESLSWAAQDAIDSAQVMPLGSGLEDFAPEVGSMIEADPGPSAFQFELALQGLRWPEVGEQVEMLYRHFIETFRSALLEAGVEADEDLARLVFAAVDGLSLQQLIFGDRQSTDRAMERLRELLELAAERKQGKTGP